MSVTGSPTLQALLSRIKTLGRWDPSSPNTMVSEAEMVRWLDLKSMEFARATRCLVRKYPNQLSINNDAHVGVYGQVLDVLSVQLLKEYDSTKVTTAADMSDLEPLDEIDPRVLLRSGELSGDFDSEGTGSNRVTKFRLAPRTAGYPRKWFWMSYAVDAPALDEEDWRVRGKTSIGVWPTPWQTGTFPGDFACTVIVTYVSLPDLFQPAFDDDFDESQKSDLEYYDAWAVADGCIADLLKAQREFQGAAMFEASYLRAIERAKSTLSNQPGGSGRIRRAKSWRR